MAPAMATRARFVYSRRRAADEASDEEEQQEDASSSSSDDDEEEEEEVEVEGSDDEEEAVADEPAAKKHPAAAAGRKGPITISLKKVCKVCKKTGHEAGFKGAVYIDCPMKPCFLCKMPGHTTLTCPHRVAMEHGVIPAPRRNTNTSLDYVFQSQVKGKISMFLYRGSRPVLNEEPMDAELQAAIDASRPPSAAPALYNTRRGQRAVQPRASAIVAFSPASPLNLRLLLSLYK